MFLLLCALLGGLVPESFANTTQKDEELDECEFTTKPPKNLRGDMFVKQFTNMYSSRFGRSDMAIVFSVEGCSTITVTDGIGVIQGVIDERLSAKSGRPFIKGIIPPGKTIYGRTPPGTVVLHLEAWGGDFSQVDRLPLAVYPATGQMVYADIPGEVVVTRVVDSSGATKRVTVGMKRVRKLNRTCRDIEKREDEQTFLISNACNT